MKNMIHREPNLKRAELITLIASYKCFPEGVVDAVPANFVGGRPLAIDETHLMCWAAAFEQFGKEA